MEGLTGMCDRSTVLIMDFSGIYEEEQFWRKSEVKWLSLREISGTNCYCDEEAVRLLKEKTAGFSAGGIHFLDSGNYHYMSRIWLERITEPFGLIVFDNHTDMQPPAFGGLLSCGGWIAAAIEELPKLSKVLLIGPDEASWEQTDPALREKVLLISRECLGREGALSEKIKEYMEETQGSLPFYFSVDKDVLCPGEAYTSWSQGDMTAEELLKILEEIWEQMQKRGTRFLGVDICGECDPGDNSGCSVNDAVNERLLDFFMKKEWQNEK